MTSSYPPLTRALAEALADVLWFIDGSDDEQMNQDDAVKVMEGVTHLVSTLPSHQQQELTALLGEMTAAETNPARREFLKGVPGGLRTHRRSVLKGLGSPRKAGTTPCRDA